MQFAVVDLETTGRHFNRDRIAEIGIVVLNEAFEVVEEFETVVNPGRDLGPVHLHGLKAAWARNAPTFADVAGWVSSMLRDRIVVAHNAHFDLNFLESEFLRLDSGFSSASRRDSSLPLGLLCTKRLSKSVFGVQAQSLGWLCAQFEVTNAQEHSAIEDARATAAVFREMVISSTKVAEQVSAEAPGSLVPSLDGSKGQPFVRPKGESNSDSGVSILLNSLPPLSGSSESSDYIDHLLIFLRDMHLSIDEKRILHELALDLNLSSSDAIKAHHVVFDTIANFFWEDGVLDLDERSYLLAAAEILGIGEEHRIFRSESPLVQTRASFLNANEQGVFLLTGFTASDKDAIRERLLALGHSVVSGFSKKVTSVIALDPDSQSGKASDARKSGIPVLGSAFVHFLEKRASL